MEMNIRVALLTGTGLILAGRVAFAQMAPSPPPPDMYGPGSLHGRLADRALRDFDLNKDGKITKAEADKVEAQRFSQASGGAALMTEAEFSAAHEKMLHVQASLQFKRLDWNGDGVLSLDEFRAPLRASFAKLDRAADGTVSCEPARRHGASNRPSGTAGQDTGHNQHGARPSRRYGGRIVKLCQDADLNKDGKITRAEFDKAVAAKYAQAAKGGKGLTPDAFYQLERVRFEDMESRRFKRLDKNNDGKLSEVEFAAPGQKLFARLDKNRDGTLTKDELSAPRHVRHGRQGKGPR